MNERIQALADQAEDYADSIVDQGGEFHQAYTQKLTELVIAECAKFTDYSEELYKHFGVEK